jgi:GH25 family lysozyme M1 (1,4-beta-N-acetylmuramidase)
MKRGDKNDEVARFQRDLLRLGYPLPKSTRGDGSFDGICGPETLAAAEQFAIERRLVPVKRGTARQRAMRAALRAGELPASLVEQARTATAYLRGVDVSKYQGKPDWSAAAAAGVRFAFCKATQGIRTVDASFAANWAGTKAAGIRRGAYHYWEQKASPRAQAALLANTLHQAGGLLPEDFPPALDVEGVRVLPASEINERLEETVRAVEELLGVTPLLYTSARIVREWAITLPARCPLWLAYYSPGDGPALPSGSASWLLWQTGYGRGLPGFSGDVDRNLMSFPASLVG